MAEKGVIEYNQKVIKELENYIKKGKFLMETMGISITHEQFFKMVELMVTSAQYKERPEVLLHDLRILILKVPFTGLP